MGRSIVLQVIDKPATGSICCLLIAIWFWLTNKGLGYAEVGFSYDAVVQHKEWWRLLTSVVSHVELLHLIFNISGLWGLGAVERLLGTPFYLKTTLLLVLSSDLVCLLLYYVLINAARRDYYRRVTSVGYSGVIFGWMTIVAVKNPGGISKVPIFGLFSVPLYLAPFGSLILTSILVPRASFLGHLSGILMGYVIGFGLFDSITIWSALSVVLWLFIGIVYIAVNQRISVPFVRLHTEGDIETGQPPARIVDVV